MKLAHPLGKALVGPSPHPRLHERAVEADVDLRKAGNHRKLSILLLVVDPERPDVVEGSGFEAYEIVAADQVGRRPVRIFWHHHGLVEARWKHVYEIDVACELVVLLLRYGAGDENAEMTDRLVNRVDDRLTMSADVVDTSVEIEDPTQRLLWRGDIVCLRAEHDDG